MFTAVSKKFSAAIQNYGLIQPYTDTDYSYYEDVWANTLAGETLDKHLKFVMGQGIKPVFELIDSKGKDPSQIEQELETYDDIISELEQIDLRDGINFKQNIYDGAVMAKVFGRCVIAFDPEGKDSIPEVLKIIHPRDLGRPTIDSNTWELISVMDNQAKDDILTEDMIYLVNKPNSPVRRAMYYGFSELQRVVGAARAVQRIIEYDAPEIAESMWAGYGMLVVDTEGQTESAASATLNTIAGGIKPGAFNLINGKKDNIQYFPMDLDPKVGELVQLIDTYERLIIGNVGLPAALMGRESDTNMATLYGKIRLYLTGPVQSDREWLGNIVAKQWYERILRKLHPEVLAKVRVKAEFEPMIIESWTDTVDALTKLDTVLPIPDSVKLKLLNLEQFSDEVAQERQSRNEKAQAIQKQQSPTDNNQQPSLPQNDATPAPQGKNAPITPDEA